MSDSVPGSILMPAPARPGFATRAGVAQAQGTSYHNSSLLSKWLNSVMLTQNLWYNYLQMRRCLVRRPPACRRVRAQVAGQAR
jgi:hypothetical protein